MTSPLLPLAFGNRLSLAESVEFQMLGLLVVFSVLALLWGTLELTGFFFRRAEERARAARAAARAAERGQVSQVIPNEILAVLAAAVHVTCGGRARIRAIQQASHPDTISELSRQVWTVEGRRQIFDSRRVR